MRSVDSKVEQFGIHNSLTRGSSRSDVDRLVGSCVEQSLGHKNGKIGDDVFLGRVDVVKSLADTLAVVFRLDTITELQGFVYSRRGPRGYRRTESTWA